MIYRIAESLLTVLAWIVEGAAIVLDLVLDGYEWVTRKQEAMED